jgi:hypothetical protein
VLSLGGVQREVDDALVQLFPAATADAAQAPSSPRTAAEG